MHALEFVVILGAAIVLGGIAAQRSRIGAPVALLFLGVVLGFVPAMQDVHLPPELMLMLFLPLLLYWESLNTSLREIRSSLRGIVLVSTLLVALTAAAVAVVAHWLGLSWGAAWVLGAAIAPTDATAVAALAKGLPRRALTTIRAESLINDGTALVIYGLAVSAVVAGTAITVGYVAWHFVFAYVVGAACGIAIGLAGTWARGRISDPSLMNTMVLLLPFTSYFAAEELGASGVIGVVACGLLLSQTGPRVGFAAQRVQMGNAWTFDTYLINAALFVMIGLELNSAVRSLSEDDLVLAAVGAVLITLLLALVRYLFLVAAAYTIRALDRRPAQLARRVTNRARVVGTLAGFRGAVSLAAAIAVPSVLASGDPFPDRDLIVCITATVVTLTIVVQGSLFGRAIRWANLPPDSIEQELAMARLLSAQAAFDAMADTAERLATPPEVEARVRNEYREGLVRLEATHDGAEDLEEILERNDAETQLRIALIEVKRLTMIDLRDRQEIDDTVLRQMQLHLDIEELRLSGAPLHE